MNFWMIFKVAILAILRNKTRALLTCLGIIVGIAAVIAVLAIGKGASTMMLNEISTMGNNLMMIWPDWNRRGQRGLVQLRHQPRREEPEAHDHGRPAASALLRAEPRVHLHAAAVPDGMRPHGSGRLRDPEAVGAVNCNQ